MEIRNYIVNKTDERFIILIEQKHFKRFDLKNSFVYISKDKVKDSIVYIYKPESKEHLDLINFDINLIKNIDKLKKVTIALLDQEGTVVDGYELDVKVVK